MIVRGFWLPRGLEPPGLTTLSLGDNHEILVEVPVLTPAFLSTLLNHLRIARDRHLATRPVAEILDIVDRTIARWQDPADPFRRIAETALPAVTGFSPAMIRHGLTAMLAPYRTKPLQAVLEDEVGDPELLDEFQPNRRDASRRSRAYGPRLTVHIFSGNIPALPAHSLIYALLVKSASLGKSASAEPVFPALFVQSLAEIAPEIADCLAVVWWKGGEQALERAVCEQADAVLAYGDDASLNALRAITPVSTPFIGYGHKVSLALIGRNAGAALDQLAGRLADDIAFFDQQGCLSPHVVYMEERGGSPPTAERFARRLAEALEAVEVRLSSGRIETGVAGAVRQVRGAAEFEALARGESRSIRSDPALRWTVLYETDPRFVPSPLARTIRVKPVTHLVDVVEHLRPWRSVLQAVGVAVNPETLGPLAEALGALGIARVCPIGRMQSPRLAWHGEAGLRLLDLIRWTDLET